MEGRLKTRGGFTLLEVLTAFTVLALILGLLGERFLSQARAYKHQETRVNQQQALRAGMALIIRDLRSAGYPGLGGSFLQNLNPWVPASFIARIPVPAAPAGLITVTPADAQSDVLSLITFLAGETNPAVLPNGASQGDTLLLTSLTASEASDQYHAQDVIYLGKPPEMAVVCEVRGRYLVIDTDPLMPGYQGLSRSHPPGTETGEISFVHYAVFNDQNDPGGRYHELNQPVLKRKINGSGFEPLAEGLVSLKAASNPAGWTAVTLSALPAAFQGPPPAGLGLTLSTRVSTRNVSGGLGS
jgi:type II secretory pathway pseudopilin PulG